MSRLPHSWRERGAGTGKRGKCVTWKEETQRSWAVSSMSEGVLVALIGLCGSGLGSLLGIAVTSRLTQYRLEQLEKKQKKKSIWLINKY